MGIPGQIDHPDFTAALDRVIAAARRHGKAAGILLRDGASVAASHARGLHVPRRRVGRLVRHRRRPARARRGSRGPARRLRRRPAPRPALAGRPGRALRPQRSCGPIGPLRVHWARGRTDRARGHRARSRPHLPAPDGGGSARARDRRTGHPGRGLPAGDPAHRHRRFGVRHRPRRPARRRPHRARHLRPAGRRGRRRLGQPRVPGRAVHDDRAADAPPGADGRAMRST